MYANHRLYDEKGRRLAIFGQEIDNKLEIFVLTCSKHDSFNKRLATEVYNKYLNGEPLEVPVYGYNYPSQEKVVKSTLTFNPFIYRIDIQNPAQSKNEFLAHCSSEYCHVYPEYGVVKLLYISDRKAEEIIKTYIEND